jgi:hypothetical protein
VQTFVDAMNPASRLCWQIIEVKYRHIPVRRRQSAVVTYDCKWESLDEIDRLIRIKPKFDRRKES